MEGEKCESSCVGTVGDHKSPIPEALKGIRNPKKDFKEAQVLKENSDNNGG